MDRKWWKEAVVYQIYPRSFKDSNGDGIGDLRGIIEKLDYLKDLGVDVIWLTPIYKSPNDDNGYDVADYYQVMDEFGSMDDFDLLLEEVHKRGLKLILDLVINHTSDEHEWFMESRSSRDNPRRDYYIWRKPRDGKEPNNWLSRFSGPAWEYDERTGEYYLHLFSRKQPDLNWENPRVKNEIFEMIDWWLKKGIDGFRMDVINFIGKAEGLPDAKEPDSPEHYANQPLVHEILKDLHEEVLSRYDIMTVGETPHVTPEIARLYVQKDRKELDMVFSFEHVYLKDFTGENFIHFKKLQQRWSSLIREGGWITQYLENHDQPRSVSKFGDDKRYRKESAKMLASMLLTLPGTVFIYQGQEIGMTNVEFSGIDDYNDIKTINKYREEISKGRKAEEVLKELQPVSRDNSRTPMQWNSSIHAGFTTGEPWLKVNTNYREINVENELRDPESVLNYYKKLLVLRKKYKALVYGSYQPMTDDDSEIYAYFRELEDTKLFILLNNSGCQKDFDPEMYNIKKSRLLISNYPLAEEGIGKNLLQPYEARLYIVE
ncbi:MAG: alpha-glucosidase [Halanaerobiaceae bacterium]|jgi:oligo-1,6-glucosidase|nr:alpha-glucosidase [Halanaerobiaceae bacterium]